MDLATSEFIVFFVINLYTKCTGIIPSSAFIGSCKTTLTFRNSATSLILNYNGASLTDSLGKPCEAAVEIKHYDVSFPRISMCVKLYSGYNSCRRSFRFYFAENPDQFYSCEQIQHQAVCKQRDTVVAEFKSWNGTENTEDIKIDVYKQAYTEHKEARSGGALYVGIIVGCVVVVIVIVVAAFWQQQNIRNKRNQTDNQPRSQLTCYSSQGGSQDYQCHSYSAEPPRYTDIMAVENRDNNTSSTDNTDIVDITNINGLQELRYIQEDTINYTAPPLLGDTVPQYPPQSSLSDVFPDDCPPLYPGYPRQ